MLKILKNIKFLSSNSQKIKEIPSLRTFINKSHPTSTPSSNPFDRKQLTFHIQTYGCQMNVNDSEIVRSVLSQHYTETDEVKNADIVLLNTCSIRQRAQQRVLNRIKHISKKSAIAVLGCMAQRLKSKMFKAGVQVVCGPDAYRDLPNLLQNVLSGQKTNMNVQLSAQQTYADITPIRRDPSSVTAFLSIMRGCNNMCSFCIVPFVRGRQRSRNLDTILEQIKQLQSQGVRQVTFLGQNVNSYHDLSTQLQNSREHNNSQGFGQMYKLRDHPGARFADLLESAAKTFPNVRFRFTSPHPKDFPEQVLEVISKYNNICKYIHFPAQSGNSDMLFRMRRNHTRQAYVKLAKKMRQIPGMTLSTDMIAGFCGQTEQQFQDTISLMKQMKYEMAFLFAYSMRQKTHAHRNYQDDVPQQTKQRRLKQMIDTFIQIQSPLNEKQIEGKAKRQQGVLVGKTDHFKSGYVSVQSVPVFNNGKIIDNRQFKLGDYLVVKVQKVAPRALYCQPLGISSTLPDFYNNQQFFQNLLLEQESIPQPI